MSDIVKRLKEHSSRSVGHWEDYANKTDCLVIEAAEEINRLREALRSVAETKWDIGALEAVLCMIQNDARLAIEGTSSS